MENIEKTIMDYSTLHAFEKQQKVSTWNQTRLVVVKKPDGSKALMMRALTLGEKIRTLLTKWRPTEMHEVKEIIKKANLSEEKTIKLPTSDELLSVKEALEKKVTETFKNVGDHKVYEKLDNKGYTFNLLAIACESGNITTIKMLLSTTSVRTEIDNKDQNGQTLLMRAATKGDYAVVKELLKAGADKGIISQNNKNAFALANDNGHTAVAKLIASSNYTKH
ncbi:MAG: ankyrin repeat domain-containing protein [Chlamydiales bacterium]|nr:ankyrin repeat domain-containing protein [Chlamydiales bacterium]